MNLRSWVVAMCVVLGCMAFPAQATTSLAEPDRTITARNRAVTIDVLANDIGLGAKPLLLLMAPPRQGKVVRSGLNRIVYTPKRDYLGTDSFLYLAAGRNGIGWARVTVDVGRALTLKGQVTDAPIPGAAVFSTLDGHVFKTVADSNGRYALEIIATNEADMVAVGANGAGAQEFVSFLSIVGSVARLRAEAGADGVLTRTENNQVQLTQLSTALAYLLQLANDGQPIADEMQLSLAQRGIDVNVLTQMAAAIKLVVDGFYPLPAGASDTIALISDTAVFKQFVSAVQADEPTALAVAATATLTDPAVIALTTQANWVGDFALYIGGAGGNVPGQIVQGWTLVLRADQTGDSLEGGFLTDSAVSWAFSSGMATLVPRTPIVNEWPVIINGVSVRRLTSTVRIDLTRIVDGGASGHDMVGVVRHLRYSYPDGEYPDEMVQFSSSLLSTRGPVGELPFSATEFPALRALSVYRPELSPGAPDSLTARGYAVHRFEAAGTGRIADDGQAFTWSLDAAGRLIIAYDDGEVAQVRRLFHDGRKGDGVMVETTLPDGSSMANLNMSVVQDGTLNFNIAGLSQPWRSGFDIGRADYDFDRVWGFYILLNGPAQTGAVLSISESGRTTRPISWQLDAGKMRALIYRDNTGYVVGCTIGVNGCVVVMERRWTPLAQIGNRIYVLEELIDGSPLRVSSQRANFYEIQAPP